MKRSHVMHKRDNRRGFYLKNSEPMKAGPCVEWRRTEDGNQMQLWIGGVLHARINAVGDPRYGYDEHGNLEHGQDWEAETENGKRQVFPDADAARLFCEREYATP